MHSHLGYQWYFQMVILGFSMALSYVAHTCFMKTWILWTSMGRKGAGTSQIPELLLAWPSCPPDFQGENQSAVHWVSQTLGDTFRLSNLFLWSLCKYLREKSGTFQLSCLGGGGIYHRVAAQSKNLFVKLLLISIVLILYIILLVLGPSDQSCDFLLKSGFWSGKKALYFGISYLFNGGNSAESSNLMSGHSNPTRMSWGGGGWGKDAVTPPQIAPGPTNVCICLDHLIFHPEGSKSTLRLVNT